MQFSIHRIWLLVKKQWAENLQLYCLGLLAVTGVMAAVIVFNITENEGLTKPTQQNLVLVGLMVSGSIFTTTILSQFNDKIKGIQALTLPASTLEKLVVALLYSIVVFPICFLVLVYPLICLGHYIDAEMIGKPNLLYIPEWNKQLPLVIFLYLLLQGIALMCSVLFKRYVFIKAVILTIAVFFGVLILNPWLAKKIIGPQVPKQITANIHETVYDDHQNVLVNKTVKELIWTNLYPRAPYADMELNNWGIYQKYKNIDYESYHVVIRHNYNALFYALLVISVPFLWLITWFRLKEKEL
ncbi:hypothetical protein [Mucilaginibacter sp. FT3.2]|uniref:hypothetical protein n=1 Tax=Mucilaginibacter sp. FT3.2 TaxID=2723090 RepID=UPI00161F2EED|nr:hypothetical protein [Mucilaginibacter sp. FT3.2]MBB6232512.1 hypothetical protein [Mucilaginibacter sp. FT3.2]